MKDSTKKLIIWISVAVVIVGGSIGGYVWYSNRPEKDGDTNEDDSDTGNKDNTNTGGVSGGGNSGGSSGGNTGATSGTGVGGGAGSTAGTGTAPVNIYSNYDAVKKFFGNSAREYVEGNKSKIVVKKTQSDFNKDWGLGAKKIEITYNKIGNFWIKIEGINDDNAVLAGTYSNGGKKLYVTEGALKLSKNKFLTYNGLTQTLAIQKVLTVS